MKRLIGIFCLLLFICLVTLSLVSCVGIQLSPVVPVIAEGPLYKCRVSNMSDYKATLTIERFEESAQQYKEFYKEMFNPRQHSCDPFPGATIGIPAGRYRVTLELIDSGGVLSKNQEIFELSREEAERENVIEYGHGGNGTILSIEIHNPGE